MEEYRYRELDTDRLKLVRILPDHARDMYRYASDEETVRFMSWPRHKNLKQTKDYIEMVGELYDEGCFYDWAVILKETGRMIGTIGLHNRDRENNSAEMGYIIARDYWGLGLVPEGARRILRFCFEDLEIECIKTYCDRENLASERVMIKLGMTYGGEEPHKVLKSDEEPVHKWYYMTSPLSGLEFLPFDMNHYRKAMALWRVIPGMGLSSADKAGQIERYLEKNRGSSFVCLDGDRLVGTILAGDDGRRGYIHHTAVDRDYRERGIASFLTEKAMDVLCRRGIEKVHLLVFSNNERGQEFWLGRGWEKRGDIDIMSKNLKGGETAG